MEKDQKQVILEKLQALKTLRIFFRMEEKDIFEVMKRSEMLKYEPGDVVFSEGDQDDSLYVIITGRFEVISQNTEGEKLTFFVAGQGLIFGEMSFLDENRRSATIVAVETSEVFKLTRAKYEELLQVSPVSAAKFMFGVSEILSRRLRGANQRIKHAT